jgi:hypothetical protein
MITEPGRGGKRNPRIGDDFDRPPRWPMGTNML